MDKGALALLAHRANLIFVDEEPVGEDLHPCPITVDSFTLILYLKKEIDYAKQIQDTWTEMLKMCDLLGGVTRKLNNDKFIERARPEIVQKERDKKTYYEDNITELNNKLDLLECNNIKCKING